MLAYAACVRSSSTAEDEDSNDFFCTAVELFVIDQPTSSPSALLNPDLDYPWYRGIHTGGSASTYTNYLKCRGELHDHDVEKKHRSIRCNNDC